MDFSFVEIAVRFANIAEEQCFNHDCIWWQPTFGFHKCVRTDLQKMNQTLSLPKPKANGMSCKRIEWRLLYSHFQYFIRNYMCTISAVIAITRAGLDFLHSPHINSFIRSFIISFYWLFSFNFPPNTHRCTLSYTLCSDDQENGWSAAK